MRRLLCAMAVLFVPAIAYAQVAFTKQICDAAGASCSGAFAPMAPGTTLTVRLTADQITPSGPGSLGVIDAVVTDALPPQLEYLSHTIAGPTAPWTCTAPQAGHSGTVQCRVGFFPSGPATTIDIRVRLAATTAGGTYTNHATFAADLIGVDDERLPFTIPASAAFNVIGPAVSALSDAMLLALVLILGTVSVLRVRS